LSDQSKLNIVSQEVGHSLNQNRCPMLHFKFLGK